jgi:hypothetical protein
MAFLAPTQIRCIFTLTTGKFKSNRALVFKILLPPAGYFFGKLEDVGKSIQFRKPDQLFMGHQDKDSGCGIFFELYRPEVIIIR